ncbi:MAG: PspC domain-containing protein [Nanoarchaeota archaeon]
MVEKLYRSKQDRIVAGVCAGIADYFKIDPVWVRLAAVLLIFVNGTGILAYLIAWIIIPEEPGKESVKKTKISIKADKKVKKPGNGPVVFGVILIFISIGLMTKHFFPFFQIKLLFYTGLIIFGLYLVMRKEK